MSKKKTDEGGSMLPAIPGMDLLPDQGSVADAAPKTGGGPGFLGFGKGRYTIFEDDLGTEILAVVGPWRARASLWENGQITLESFDSGSKTYSAIKSAKKAGGGSSDGPSVGPEYLLWLPDHQRFALVHLKNTASKVAPAMQALQGKLARLGVHKNRNDKRNFTWYTPTVAPALGVPSSVPTELEWQEAVAEFLAPLREPEGQAGGSRPR